MTITFNSGTREIAWQAEVCKTNNPSGPKILRVETERGIEYFRLVRKIYSKAVRRDLMSGK